MSCNSTIKLWFSMIFLKSNVVKNASIQYCTWKSECNWYMKIDRKINKQSINERGLINKCIFIACICIFIYIYQRNYIYFIGTLFTNTGSLHVRRQLGVKMSTTCWCQLLGVNLGVKLSTWVGCYIVNLHVHNIALFAYSRFILLLP